MSSLFYYDIGVALEMIIRLYILCYQTMVALAVVALKNWQKAMTKFVVIVGYML